MKIGEVLARGREIERMDRVGDHDDAHSLEDKLRAEVLSAIADGGCEDAKPEVFAAVALATNSNGFPRWVA